MPAVADVDPQLLLLVDDHDFGVIVEMGQERVHDELAEAAPERHQVFRRQPLVGKVQHQMLEERRVDRGEGIVAERPGKIDAGDLGAERAGNRRYPDRRARHGRNALPGPRWSSPANGS
jgi:hypothetical protein